MIGMISAGTLAARAARALGRGLVTRWYLVPIALLAVQLLVTRHALTAARHELAAEQAAAKATAESARTVVASADRAMLVGQLRAATTYADRLAARAPVIVRSTDTVREYAQTDSGRARCLAPDRVRGIDALDRDLADDPGPAAGSAGAVPPHADAPAG